MKSLPNRRRLAPATGRWVLQSRHQGVLGVEKFLCSLMCAVVVEHKRLTSQGQPTHTSVAPTQKADLSEPAQTHLCNSNTKRLTSQSQPTHTSVTPTQKADLPEPAHTHLCDPDTERLKYNRELRN